MGLDFLSCRNVSSYYDPVEEEYLTDPFGLFALPYNDCQELRGENWTRYCIVCVRPPPPPPHVDTPPAPYEVRIEDGGDRRAVFFFFIAVLVIAFFAILFMYNFQQWRQYRLQRQGPASQTIFSRPTRILIRSRTVDEHDVEAGGREESRRLETSTKSKNLMTVDEILNLPKVMYQGDPDSHTNHRKRKKRKTVATKTKRKSETKNAADFDESPSSRKQKKGKKKGKNRDGEPDVSRFDQNGNSNRTSPQMPCPASSKSMSKKKSRKQTARTQQSESTCVSACSICLEDFHNGDVLRELPQCHHLFHTDCLIPWLTENHKRCPMCTTPVLDTLTTGSNDAE
jgi:hypothetical protein